MALFFDDVNTTLPNLVFARDGAIKFIRKGLDAEERVGIFTASGTLTLDFTEDVQKLLDTLGKLRSALKKMPDQGARRVMSRNWMRIKRGSSGICRELRSNFKGRSTKQESVAARVIP